MQIKVSYFILVSFSHIGDYNQAINVKSSFALKNLESFKVQLVDSDNFSIIQIQQCNILHLVGQKALFIMSSIKQSNPQTFRDLFLVIQIHQHFKQINQIQPNFLIIPQVSYKACKDQKFQKYLLNGTLFDRLSDQQLKIQFEKSSINQINLKENYLIVMLSGDAPDQQKMNYFTKKSALNLFQKIKNILSFKRFKVIVQNGPRTGKYDPETENIACMHKYKKNHNPYQAIDQVSKYFLQQLKKQQIDYLFYNFAFQIDNNIKKVISFYKPLLHVSKINKNNIFLFPMESVSMCSELPYYIEPERLYCYQTSSTNDLHKKVAQLGLERGLYSIIMERSEEIQSPKKFISRTYDETSEAILALIKQYKKINQSKLFQNSILY